MVKYSIDRLLQELIGTEGLLESIGSNGFQFMILIADRIIKSKEDFVELSSLEARKLMSLSPKSAASFSEIRKSCIDQGVLDYKNRGPKHKGVYKINKL